MSQAGVVRELQELLLEKDVPDDVRVAVLSKVDGVVSSMEATQRKRVASLVLQRTFLQVLLGAAVILIGVGLVRIPRLKEVMMAQAYRVNLDRVGINARVGVAAMDLLLTQIAQWAKEVGERQDSLEAKRVHLENLRRIGDVLKVYRASFEKDYRATLEARSKVPDRLTPLTVVEDPLSGMALPLNATADGGIDQGMLDAFFRKQEWIMGLMAAAKQASQPGFDGLLPRYDPKAETFVLDEEAMAAAGVRLSRPLAGDGELPPPPGSTGVVPGVQR